jgi:putative FmdB family regulatory protein
MPLFEYKCTDCGKAFDDLVSHPDDPVECPFCHSRKAEKQLSVFAAGAGSSASPATPCGRPSCGSGFS